MGIIDIVVFVLFIVTVLYVGLSKSKGGRTLDLETAKMLSNNPTLTQKELDELKKAAKEKKKLEPTGKFKKD